MGLAMRVYKIFAVDDEGITTEDITDAELLDRVKGATGERWHRDEEWPVLFVPADTGPGEGGEGEGEDEAEGGGPGGTTLVVPFEDPAEFRLMVQNEGLDDVLAVGDLDFDLLERIEEEMA